MNTYMTPDRRKKSAKTVNSYVMLYLQYASDMLGSTNWLLKGQYKIGSEDHNKD
jgi:hypothetical protein